MRFFVLLLEEGLFVPIPTLVNDLVIFYPEEPTAAQPFGVLPFQNPNIPVFKNVFNDADHFKLPKVLFEHLDNFCFSFKDANGGLVIDAIIRIKLTESFVVVVVKPGYPGLEELLG